MSTMTVESQSREPFPDDIRGRRLLPSWIDEVARKEPERVWASMPRASDPKDGFRDVEYSRLASAVDKIAWWVESIIGRSSDFETVAYMG